MIDVYNITNFNRTKNELEEFLIFSVAVAGKKAEMTARKVDDFLHSSKCRPGQELSPFEYLRHLQDIGSLGHRLQSSRLGQYNRLAEAFSKIARLAEDLKHITVETLESVRGIGPKTARFFCLHSRPNYRAAVLDTHILHFLRDLGYKTPKTTPNGNKYLYWENIFLELCSTLKKSPAELDLSIWSAYAKKEKKELLELINLRKK